MEHADEYGDLSAMSLLRAIAQERPEIRSMISDEVETKIDQPKDVNSNVEFREMAEKLIETIENGLCKSNTEPRIHNRKLVRTTTCAGETMKRSAWNSLSRCKVVEIDKSNQPLGLTIMKNPSGKLLINRILVGSIASKYKLFRLNDEILAINDQPISGRSIDEISSWVCQRKGLIKFLLCPSKETNGISYETFHVRALFDFDPSKDCFVSCREIGLKMKKFDILHVVASNSELSFDCWQAFRNETFPSSFAGLIPSEEYLEHRWKEKHSTRPCFNFVRRKENRLKSNSIFENVQTSIHHLSYNDLRLIEQEPTTNPLERSNKTPRFYERIFRLNLKETLSMRPVILLGPSQVARHKLRIRLVRSSPDIFALPRTETTRAPKTCEADGVDYKFVGKEEFFKKAENNLFVEFVQYEGAYYGTAVDEVRRITQEQKKVCLLNLNPSSVDRFEKTNLFPYVILICPPTYRSIKSHGLHRVDHLLISENFERTVFELRSLIIHMQSDRFQWARTCYRMSNNLN